MTIVTTATIYTLIAQLSCDQVCSDLQWLLYLAVGVGLPQYLLSRRTGSRLRLGLACLAAAGGAFVAVAGIGTGSLHAEWSGGLVAILFAVVLGNVLGAGVREFRSGYRSTSRP